GERHRHAGAAPPYPHRLVVLDTLTTREALHDARDLVGLLPRDKEGHVLADDFVSPVAVELLGGRVPGNDGPAHIHRQDSVVGGLHDRCEPSLGFLAALALSEITHKRAEVPVTPLSQGTYCQLDREF